MSVLGARSQLGTPALAQPPRGPPCDLVIAPLAHQTEPRVPSLLSLCPSDSLGLECWPLPCQPSLKPSSHATSSRKPPWFPQQVVFTGFSVILECRSWFMLPASPSPRALGYTLSSFLDPAQPVFSYGAASQSERHFTNPATPFSLLKLFTPAHPVPGRKSKLLALPVSLRSSEGPAGFPSTRSQVPRFPRWPPPHLYDAPGCPPPGAFVHGAPLPKRSSPPPSGLSLEVTSSERPSLTPQPTRRPDPCTSTSAHWELLSLHICLHIPCVTTAFLASTVPGPLQVLH